MSCKVRTTQLITASPVGWCAAQAKPGFGTVEPGERRGSTAWSISCFPAHLLTTHLSRLSTNWSVGGILLRDQRLPLLVSRCMRMNLPHSCMNLYELSCPALYQCPSPLCDGGEAHGRWPGDALVGATHRYAGVTPHLTPGPSPALRHATRADGAARAVWQFIQASYCIILRSTHISGGLGGCWQCGVT